MYMTVRHVLRAVPDDAYHLLNHQERVVLGELLESLWHGMSADEQSRVEYEIERERSDTCCLRRYRAHHELSSLTRKNLCSCKECQSDSGDRRR